VWYAISVVGVVWVAIFSIATFRAGSVVLSTAMNALGMGGVIFGSLSMPITYRYAGIHDIGLFLVFGFAHCVILQSFHWDSHPLILVHWKFLETPSMFPPPKTRYHLDICTWCGMTFQMSGLLGLEATKWLYVVL
jgi:hypothetical protein